MANLGVRAAGFAAMLAASSVGCGTVLAYPPGFSQDLTQFISGSAMNSASWTVATATDDSIGEPTFAAANESAPVAKDSEQIQTIPEDIQAPASPVAPGSTPGATPSQPSTEDAMPNDDDNFDDDVSVGEIPAVETVELTEDSARRAIDAYVTLKDKYKDAELENYENLQDFVDNTPQGKAFEADVKAAGFANVNEWNLVITTASFTYSNVIDDQTDDIKQQIEDVKEDPEIAQDMKDRMIKSLQAMIPSENNRKIIEKLTEDPAFSDKIKSLEVEGE